MEFLGERGILFADLSGYTQIVYQCVYQWKKDTTPIETLAIALFRLFEVAARNCPTVAVEAPMSEDIR